MNKKVGILYAFIVAISLVFLAGCSGARNEPASKQGSKDAGAPDTEFFKGKTIRIIVGYSPGGGYDSYARLVAPYLQKYLPGSTVIVENVPGAGSIVGATQLFNSPPDGLTLGTFNSGLIVEQLIGNKQIKFDLKKFTWLAKSTSANPVVVMGKKSPYQTADALLNSKNTVKFGSEGPGSESHNNANILAYVFKYPVKIVAGFAGSQEIYMAAMRGEVDGLEASYDSARNFIDNGEGVVILQMGEKKGSELPNVPLARDLVKDEKSKSLLDVVSTTASIGKPIAAPPGLPKEREAALIEALKKAYADPELKEKADKMKLTLDPAFGKEVSDRVITGLSQSEDNVKVLVELLGKK